jgi:predicted nucleotidyltransferase
MSHQISPHTYTWHGHLKELSVAPVDEAFLGRLVAELDSDDVTAIILRGSCARGDATSYSDIDLTRIVKYPPEEAQQKQFLYREGRLVSLSTRTLAQERARLALPEQAIFVVQGIREARILLEKDGAFRALQQETRAFTWQSLQAVANDYVSRVLMLHTEYVHKILRALLLHDEIALSEITLELLFVLTEAVAIQRGVLVISGNTYFRQVQDMVGTDSAWTYYHKLVGGMDTRSAQPLSGETRGVAALRLYQETVKLLRPILCASHRDVVEESVAVIEQALSDEDIT